MDRAYDGFCIVDPLFYDSPMVARDDDVDFAIAASDVPPGWKRDEFEDWLVLTPEACDVPNQGWKIHASATLDHAEKVLAAIWDYCISGGIPFKFVRSQQLLLLANGKYAHRGSSGKFVTIYPVDDVQLETILTELGAALFVLNNPAHAGANVLVTGPNFVSGSSRERAPGVCSSTGSRRSSRPASATSSRPTARRSACCW